MEHVGLPRIHHLGTSVLGTSGPDVLMYLGCVFFFHRDFFMGLLKKRGIWNDLDTVQGLDI